MLDDSGLSFYRLSGLNTEECQGNTQCNGPKTEDGTNNRISRTEHK